MVNEAFTSSILFFFLFYARLAVGCGYGVKWFNWYIYLVRPYLITQLLCPIRPIPRFSYGVWPAGLLSTGMVVSFSRFSYLLFPRCLRFFFFFLFFPPYKVSVYFPLVIQYLIITVYASLVCFSQRSSTHYLLHMSVRIIYDQIMCMNIVLTTIEEDKKA